MANDLYRVVRTRVGRSGNVGTVASEPLTRDEAMARFADCVTLGWDRLRVVREQDYKPSELGPQNQPGVYRGEAARRPAPIHYQPSTLKTALSCGERVADLEFLHQATFRLADVTCTDCLDAVTAGAGGQ
jgi:hypothetical protein